MIVEFIDQLIDYPINRASLRFNTLGGFFRHLYKGDFFCDFLFAFLLIITKTYLYNFDPLNPTFI